MTDCFEAFTFPAYPSPFDWHAAYQGREQVLKEIICSYEEQVIKVYNVAQETDLDLWRLEIPASRLGDLGAVFQDLDRRDCACPSWWPFPWLPGSAMIQVACCLAQERSS